MPFFGYIKKIFVAALLGILVFNWCGYRMLAFYVENRANAALQQRLDKDDYDHSELISIKIASPNLPYYNSSKKFCNVEGEIEMDGIFYKFVKRRLYNDTLEFLCLPNKELMNLYTAKNDFFKRVNDIQMANGEKKTTSHTSTIKAPLGEYFFDEKNQTFENLFSLTSATHFLKNSSLTTRFSPAPDKPPQLA